MFCVFIAAIASVRPCVRASVRERPGISADAGVCTRTSADKEGDGERTRRVEEQSIAQTLDRASYYIHHLPHCLLFLY